MVCAADDPHRGCCAPRETIQLGLSRADMAGSRRQLQVCGLPSVKRFVRKLRGVRSPEARVITLWYYSRVLAVDRKYLTGVLSAKLLCSGAVVCIMLKHCARVTQRSGGSRVVAVLSSPQARSGKRYQEENMTFDETLYGRGSDDGDDLGDSESFEDVIDEEEELEDEELEEEEDEAEEQELGNAEDEGVAPSASPAQREEEASKAPAESAPPAKKPAKKVVKTTSAKKAAAQTPTKKAAKKAAVKSVAKKTAKKAVAKTATKKAAAQTPAKKAAKKAAVKSVAKKAAKKAVAKTATKKAAKKEAKPAKKATKKAVEKAPKAVKKNKNLTKKAEIRQGAKSS